MQKNKLYEDVLCVDDIILRQRYPRQSSIQQNRRKPRRSKRGREKRESLSLVQKIVVQTIICVFILLTVAILKSVDSPVTNYCRDKIKGILSYNVDIKSVFSQIDSLLDKTKGDSIAGHGDDNSEADNAKSTIRDTAVLGDENSTNMEDDGMYVESAENISAVEQSWDQSDNETVPSDEAKADDPNLDNSFIIPVGGIIGSLYGERIHPINGTKEFHQGIDIQALSGTPIKAASKGEVVEAGESETYGNYIKIKHKEDIISLYAHCSVLLVKEGQSVDKGETIAKVGSTGISDGPHLHFEVRQRGEPVNPLDFVQSSSN